MINIVCAWKTGGDFTSAYVRNLAGMVYRTVKDPYIFTCFTDVSALSNDAFVSLDAHLTGWWSKLACFRMNSYPTIYLDLDTIILDDMQGLINAVKKCRENEFFMLKPQRATEKWASGIMAWNGDFKWILDKFDSTDEEKYKWDQRYISNSLEEKGIKIRAIQRIQHGIYSYKKHCKKGVPEDAKIILFHGKPRPHEVKDEWVKDNWC